MLASFSTHKLMKTLLCIVAGVFTSNLIAQQKFINVPSGEATGTGKLFFQQQFNFCYLIQSNTTLDVGVGSGIEIGVNILGLDFNDRILTFFSNESNHIDPYYPLVTFNSLKTLKLNKHISI